MFILFIYVGYYRALGRKINARYLKERLIEKDPNFGYSTRTTIELIQQLDILADTLFIEASLLGRYELFRTITLGKNRKAYVDDFCAKVHRTMISIHHHDS